MTTKPDAPPTSKIIDLFDALKRSIAKPVPICTACRGNVAPGRACYACGLHGPTGEGKAMCPKCLRFGPHECKVKP